MDFKTLLGLPAHPLVVHGAIVLVPLVAIGTIIVAFWPRARGVFGWAVAVLSVAAFGFVGLAQKTGGALANHVEPTALTRAHVEMGDAVLPWAFVIMGIACSVMALTWYLRHIHQSTESPSWFRPLSIALGTLAVLAALGGTVQVYRVGHSGAKATWSHVDMNGPSTGGGEGG
jgi:hypothetical protein